MRILVIALWLISISTAFAQDKLEISFDKSVILVFEQPVKPKGWNCGQKELVGIGVQENKVIVQAKEEYFDETNLVIELTDGSIYAFTLVYNNNPKNFFFVIPSARAAYKPAVPIQPVQQPVPTSKPENANVAQAKEAQKERKPKREAKITQEQTSEHLEKKPDGEKKLVEVKDVASAVAGSQDYLKRIGVIDKKMFLYVGGIFVVGDKLAFKVNIKNTSTVPYDVDYSQFLVKNIRTGITRNVSPRADKLEPVYILEPEQKTIQRDETKVFVFVFEKFTISDDKKLFIEFWEANGDRNLEVPVESIEILNAKRI